MRNDERLGCGRRGWSSTVRESLRYKKMGFTAAQVALPGSVTVPSRHPIIGHELTSLKTTSRALKCLLVRNNSGRLDEVSAVQRISGQYLEEGMSRTITFGGLRDRIRA